MKLHHLRNLLAIGKEGSVRAAARELGMAQPALRRSIRELEQKLGVPLFERKARGVSLTVAGEAFTRRARSIDNELLRLRKKIAQLQGIAHGTVRIAMSMVPHMALRPDAARGRCACRSRLADPASSTWSGYNKNSFSARASARAPQLSRPQPLFTLGDHPWTKQLQSGSRRRSIASSELRLEHVGQAFHRLLAP